MTSDRASRCFANTVLMLLTLTLQTGLALAQESSTANPLGALRWRFVGPYGNRAAAIAGEAGNPMVDYVGAAAGGIWKTENGGVDWKAVFDHEDVSAVGALAVSESDPHTVWAGTGETFLIRPFYPMGDGVYKSTDAGEHWQHMGLDSTGHVGRIVIDPHNAERVFVCALGQAFKQEPNRGVYRTLDGGRTWEHVLSVDTGTGCSDLAMDPNDPNTLFAGMWPLLIYPWDLHSGGRTGGVYVTHDGGATWHKLGGHGLPGVDHPLGKVAVAIAHSNPKVVYALVQDSQPGLYRSDDGGETWAFVSHDHMMMQRDSYYVRFGISTSDPDRLYFLSPNYVISLDGGKTFIMPRRGGASGARGFASAGGDNHDMWIDPTNPDRIMVANDAGAQISLDGSKSFEHIRLPIAQVYHVSVDDQTPYNIYGNLQDASSFFAPSNTLSGGFFGGGIRASDFRPVGGCESGFATPDPSDNDIVWSGCYEGVITRINLKDGQVRDVSVWPDVADGWPASDIKERWHWTVPLEISPFNPKQVYVGSQYVHMTTDGGQTWKRISPDLTLNDKSHQGNTGGITYDNLYTYDGDVIYSIAESPRQEGLIWVGTNDGQVNLTKDGGANWTNLTKNIPNLPPYGTIWNIEPSNFDAATAYITVNLEQMGDYDAYVYKTSDYGQSWKLISAGVPKSVNSSAHCVIEDPVRPGMLYLGSDNAIYVSWDDGDHWTKLNNNMPPAPVYWLTVQQRFDDLVIATYGRGDFILDDLGALRGFDKAQAAGAVQLFTPRPAYRFRQREDTPLSEPGTRVVGQNPPYGADINFYLPTADAGATVTIAGSDGKTIRTLDVKARAGLNRVWWDLRGENGKMPHLLVPPPDAPWVENGADGYRIVTGIMIPNTVRGPMAVPGTYSVTLSAAGTTATAELRVLADPHSLGTSATMSAQATFQQQVIGEIDRVSGMIEQLEQARQRVATVMERVGNDPKQKAVVAAANRLADSAMAIEGKLIDIYLTDGNEDLNRHPSQLYQKLTALYDKDQADLGPTAAELQVNEYFRQWMAQSQAALTRFEAKDVPAFDAVLRAHHLSLTP
jgi:photosystem II stability/assembly factor-like uncharacterized protein